MIPQKLKLLIDFLETFPECSLSSTVWKDTIKMIGHHSRSREVTDQSCPIYGCARDNHARYSSVQVIFCDSSKHNLLKQYLRKKNPTGRKCPAYGTKLYEICRKITPFKTTWTQSVRIVAVFAVVICIPEYIFLNNFNYIFFSFR